MTQKDRVLSMIGLAARAGRVVSGEYSTQKAVKAGKAHLVIVAEDASANTRKMYRDMCSWYRTDLVEFGTKEELGRHTGKTYRASICILDEGFAKTVKEKMRLNMEV